MINFLLSDEWVAKMRKIPKFLWYVLMALSFFFSEMYAYLISGEAIAMTMEETIAEMGITVNYTGFSVLYILFYAIVTEVIFELFNHFASGVLIARFSARTNREDFRFRVRLCYFYANIVIGIFGIIYFFTQTENGVYTGTFNLFGSQANMYYANDVYTIMTSFVPFVLHALALVFFYDDFQKRFLPVKNVTRAFTYVARIYFGVSIAYEIVQVASNIIITQQDFTPVEYASYWVALATVVLCAVGAYLYYLLRLKKIKDENKDDNGPSITVIPKDDKKNIYDDFGF